MQWKRLTGLKHEAHTPSGGIGRVRGMYFDWFLEKKVNNESMGG
jgi:hypothetical protein